MEVGNEFEKAVAAAKADAAKAEETFKAVEAAVKAKAAALFKAVLARVAYVGVGVAGTVVFHLVTGLL